MKTFIITLAFSLTSLFIYPQGEPTYDLYMGQLVIHDMTYPDMIDLLRTFPDLRLMEMRDGGTGGLAYIILDKSELTHGDTCWY